MAAPDAGGARGGGRTVEGASARAGPIAPRALVEVSSPICYAEAVDDAYMGSIVRDALVAELNLLLELERAGARIAGQLVIDADDPELKGLARAIHTDKSRWCRMLLAAIAALHGAPSLEVHAFYGEATSIGDVVARIVAVNGCQLEVAARLRRLLPQVRADGLHATLSEMLAAHERNIQGARFTLRSCAVHSGRH